MLDCLYSTACSPLLVLDCLFSTSRAQLLVLDCLCLILIKYKKKVQREGKRNTKPRPLRKIKPRKYKDLFLRSTTTSQRLTISFICTGFEIFCKLQPDGAKGLCPRAAAKNLSLKKHLRFDFFLSFALFLSFLRYFPSFSIFWWETHFSPFAKFLWQKHEKSTHIREKKKKKKKRKVE